MKTATGTWQSKAGAIARGLAFRLIKWGLIVVVAIVAGFAIYASKTLPPVQPWHTARLDSEFNAQRDGKLDFAGYLELEIRLFREMDAEIARWDHASEDFVFSRFNAASRMSKLAQGAPYNRSFRLTTATPKGRALLIHGLTDSPYSMKAMAETLHGQGFEVTVLRLPGHGTLPSMMAEMSASDWTTAVRIAARDVASRAPAGQPFYMGGHSTGGTIALQYALDALEDSSMRRPDRLLLLSPAIRITEAADVATIIHALSKVPIAAFEIFRWQDIVAEYDPYKFNSFPINATLQVSRAARTLRESIEHAVETGRIASMPPVVTWQSAVDSTVGPIGATDTLYPALKGAKHRLVLFDVNRTRTLGSLQLPQSQALFDRLRGHSRSYTLDIVGNAEAQGPRVSIKRLSPGNAQSVLATTLDWPDNLVSVGHVALPFPPDDPLYGFVPGSGHAGIPSLGSLFLRGEDGALSVSLKALTRPRSNPFWAVISSDLDAMVAEDLMIKPGFSVLRDDPARALP